MRVLQEFESPGDVATIEQDPAQRIHDCRTGQRQLQGPLAMGRCRLVAGLVVEPGKVVPCNGVVDRGLLQSFVLGP